MDRRRLLSFITLAEELHFGRAAVRSNITQPALSQQLRQLEEELQVELMHRTKRQVSLTRAGEAFVTEARKIVASMDHATHLTREIGSGLSGQIVIGATAPALYIVLPAIIKRYREVMPGIQVMVREMATIDQEGALRAGDIDVGICHPPLEDLSLACVDIARLQFDVVMSEANPLATKRILRLRDLANERFIVFARAVAPNMYDRIISMCQEEGFSPKVIVEASPAQSIVGLAACGVGIGWIASKQQHFAQPLAVFRSLTGPVPILTLGASHAGKNTSIAVQKFVEVARQTGRNLR
ncbi:MAG: LysR family transcriptional regulator [Comamonadaceae bacterium]|nr:MAG: LysR family transcriptional regulator [Comamonadaceae bacterium]